MNKRQQLSAALRNAAGCAGIMLWSVFARPVGWIARVLLILQIPIAVPVIVAWEGLHRLVDWCSEYPTPRQAWRFSKAWYAGERNLGELRRHLGLRDIEREFPRRSQKRDGHD